MKKPLPVLCIEGLDYLLETLKTLFIEKQDGKGLSTNDYTTAEKDKLSKIENTAQVNKIEAVKINGSALPVTSKSVDIDLSVYATKSEISQVYKYKGSKPTYAQLPSTGNVVGDVWNIEQADPANKILAGDNVAWDGSKWDKLAGTFTVDTSDFATKTELSNLDNKKVDKVTGKGLSTNDYTTAEKQKLASLENYVHPTSDGNKHVPANGTTNAGKVLVATDQAGVYEWDDYVVPITNEEIDALFS